LYGDQLVASTATDTGLPTIAPANFMQSPTLVYDLILNGPPSLVHDYITPLYGY
jgi:hypothetical protein